MLIKEVTDHRNDPLKVHLHGRVKGSLHVEFQGVRVMTKCRNTLDAASDIKHKLYNNLPIVLYTRILQNTSLTVWFRRKQHSHTRYLLELVRKHWICWTTRALICCWQHPGIHNLRHGHNGRHFGNVIFKYIFITFFFFLPTWIAYPTHSQSVKHVSDNGEKP